MKGNPLRCDWLNDRLGVIEDWMQEYNKQCFGLSLCPVPDIATFGRMNNIIAHNACHFSFQVLPKPKNRTYNSRKGGRYGLETREALHKPSQGHDDGRLYSRVCTQFELELDRWTTHARVLENPDKASWADFGCKKLYFERSCLHKMIKLMPHDWINIQVCLSVKACRCVFYGTTSFCRSIWLFRWSVSFYIIFLSFLRQKSKKFIARRRINYF